MKNYTNGFYYKKFYAMPYYILKTFFMGLLIVLIVYGIASLTQYMSIILN